MIESPPNILVIICHDLGRHLNSYGVPGVRSTNIDKLAANGTRFTEAFCAAPQCSPARAALWTGRYPHANGVVGLAHGGFANDLNPDEVHLAQHLVLQGYHTHLFGIQHEASSPERCGYQHVHEGGPCARAADRVIDFIQTQPTDEKPWFAQVGFFEPHRPFPHDDVERLSPDSVALPRYLPDIPAVREDLVDLEASVASVDMACGRIFKALEQAGVADNTWIVFTADHGIALPRAKMTLYDPGIEVALIMAGPGIPEGRTANEMVSHVDIFPTFLDLLGLPKLEHLHGESFYGLLAGDAYQPRDYLFAEKTYHTYYDPMRAIRNRQWKLIVNFENAPWQDTSPDFDNNGKSYAEVFHALNLPRNRLYHPPFELYNLESDPYEEINLADEPGLRATRDRLIGELLSWMEHTGDPLLDGPIPQGAYLNRMAAFKHIGRDNKTGL